MVTRIGTELDETLKGSGGKDYIDGAGGDDTIFGGGSLDTLIGGDGDDRIISGAGPVRVYGGAGDDFIMDAYAPASVVVLHGEDGNDTIRVVNFEGLGPYGQSAVWWLFGDDGDDKIIVGSGGFANAYGGAGADIIMMSSYSSGKAFGGGGNDRLYSEHRSVINEEADIGDKYGPGGSVTLHGGAGNDVLYGYSANNDTFVFDPGDGRDVIRNFGTGEIWAGDRIDLRGFEFEMTAEEVYEKFAVERDDRIILNFGEDGKLLIMDTPYDGGTKILGQDIIDALLI